MSWSFGFTFAVSAKRNKTLKTGTIEKKSPEKKFFFKDVVQNKHVVFSRSTCVPFIDM